MIHTINAWNTILYEEQSQLAVLEHPDVLLVLVFEAAKRKIMHRCRERVSRWKRALLYPGDRAQMWLEIFLNQRF